MNCDEIRRVLPDRSDGLLETSVCAAVEAHLAGCSDCAREAGRWEESKQALYRPYDVAPLAPDLKSRILSRAKHSRRRRWGAALGYAASFAAGALVTLWVTSASPETPPRATDPVTADPPAAAVLVPFPPRRIR